MNRLSQCDLAAERRYDWRELYEISEYIGACGAPGYEAFPSISGTMLLLAAPPDAARGPAVQRPVPPPRPIPYYLALHMQGQVQHCFRQMACNWEQHLELEGI
jgi:hypothetical protein